jgi:hypothetical protein
VRGRIVVAGTTDVLIGDAHATYLGVARLQG